VAQYEISNFAQAGSESRHNLKYWTRQPYLGFGVDAHSMLVSASADAAALRLATADALEKYVAGSPSQRTVVSPSAALEETFFLGLRLSRGVDLREVAAIFGQKVLDDLHSTIAELIDDGLMMQQNHCIGLTPRGRLFSNEVFQAFLAPRMVIRSI
jgi:oxygen-independent coproporphyrinogen-3 oxidase